MEFQWLIGSRPGPRRQRPESPFSALVRLRFATPSRARTVIGNGLREPVQRAGPEFDPGGIFANNIDRALQSLLQLRRGRLLRGSIRGLAHCPLPAPRSEGQSRGAFLVPQFPRPVRWTCCAGAAMLPI